VPKVVNGHGRNTGSHERTVEPRVVLRGRSDLRSAALISEHEFIGESPTRRGFGGAAQERRERDAPTLVRLGCADDDLALDEDRVLHDGQSPADEIDVAGSEAGHLAPSQPGVAE
jgi:hypothetical protein